MISVLLVRSYTGPYRIATLECSLCGLKWQDTFEESARKHVAQEHFDVVWRSA